MEEFPTYVEAKDYSQIYPRYAFAGANGVQHCRLKIQIRGGRILILCSQLLRGHGTSIKDAAGRIRRRVWNQLVTDKIVVPTRRPSLIERHFDPLGFEDKQRQDLLRYFAVNSVWIIDCRKLIEGRMRRWYTVLKHVDDRAYAHGYARRKEMMDRWNLKARFLIVSDQEVADASA